MYWINNFLERNLQLFHVWYIVLHLHRARTVPQAIEQVPNHQGYNFAYLPFVPNNKTMEGLSRETFQTYGSSLGAVLRRVRRQGLVDPPSEDSLLSSLEPDPLSPS